MNFIKNIPFPLQKNGFTLIELLVTITVAGILLGIAVPNFNEFVRKSHTVTNANNLISALNLARSEAIKRGVQVTVFRNGATAQVWEDGWDVFSDFNADGSLDDDGDANLCETGEDCLLRTYKALPANYTLRTGATYASWVGYLSNGLSRGSGGLANDTFRLCSETADITKSRAIIISPTGRPRINTGTASCP